METGRLRATGISVNFAGLRALDDVDLELRDGEILGLIGPNGAGKSTLVNALTGFQRHTGRLVVDGVDMTGWSPRRLSRSGVRRTFQNVRLFPEMSVYENVEAVGLGLGLGHRKVRGLAGDILDWFGMSHLSSTPARSLPYGIERRLGIARILVTGARYVLLDEPAAGLNEDESDELLELLARLPERFSCGLMVIEHDLRLIMRLCHRLQVIDHGRLLAVGDPATVRRDPAVVEAYLGHDRAGEEVLGAADR
ncbi:ABC transporter ATP-binding protein [Pseudonocardia bannensis]|uniref:ABC transporter ATP-binding protein n=1 Tax=Pseudonocardia bannensis TaxID=630973 RepID=A0A848DMK6_9PSEU|nr:ABC transporter ATP-binding protein [Pseudonocardia bannensis]NMH93661.1 ABC transporter ATP-binding protein [Pseudonocardia bannensis]